MNTVGSRLWRLVAATFVIIFVAACRDSGPVETTSTPVVAVATSTPATSAPLTSTVLLTAAPEATTAVTTPETTVATTTTIGGGGWAEVPAVVSAWGALGWWDGSRWVNVAEAPEPDLTGRYRMVGLDEELHAVADGVDTFCSIEAGGEVPLPLLPWGEFDPMPAWSLAVSGPWDLQSRLEVINSQSDVYRSAVSEFLATRGLAIGNPEIVQILKADLQKDGTDEVIVVAESVTDEASLLAEEGDYSVALLRVLVDGEVQTAVLGESVVTKDQVPYILSFRVPAVADLNGDGTMEIALSSAYYEGSAILIYEYVDHDTGPRQVLGVGCGV